MNDNKKATVSPSRPLICSADGVGESAERQTPEQMAVEIQSYFAVGGTPQQFERDTDFVTAKIREAVEAEREYVLKFVSGHSWSGQTAAKDFRIYHSR